MRARRRAGEEVRPATNQADLAQEDDDQDHAKDRERNLAKRRGNRQNRDDPIDDAGDQHEHEDGDEETDEIHSAGTPSIADWSGVGWPGALSNAGPWDIRPSAKAADGARLSR